MTRDHFPPEITEITHSLLERSPKMAALRDHRYSALARHPMSARSPQDPEITQAHTSQDHWGPLVPSSCNASLYAGVLSHGCTAAPQAAPLNSELLSQRPNSTNADAQQATRATTRETRAHASNRTRPPLPPVQIVDVAHPTSAHPCIMATSHVCHPVYRLCTVSVHRLCPPL